MYNNWRVKQTEQQQQTSTEENKTMTLRAGLEPTRAKLVAFQVQRRLNHSAMAAG